MKNFKTIQNELNQIADPAKQEEYLSKLSVDERKLYDEGIKANANREKVVDPAVATATHELGGDDDEAITSRSSGSKKESIRSLKYRLGMKARNGDADAEEQLKAIKAIEKENASALNIPRTTIYGVVEGYERNKERGHRRLRIVPLPNPNNPTALFNKGEEVMIPIGDQLHTALEERNSLPKVGKMYKFTLEQTSNATGWIGLDEDGVPQFTNHEPNPQGYYTFAGIEKVSSLTETSILKVQERKLNGGLSSNVELRAKAEEMADGFIAKLNSIKGEDRTDALTMALGRIFEK